VRAHHERWEGAGYPDGLAGEEIPLAARIICAPAPAHRRLSAGPRVGARRRAVLQTTPLTAHIP
jgi:hypothetical protein